MDTIYHPWKAKTHYALLLVLAMGTVSAFFSASPQHATLEISSYIGLFYCSQLIVALWQAHQLKLVKAIILAVLASALLYMTGFFAGYLASFLEDSVAAINVQDVFLGFSNVRAFNQYQLWTLSLLYLPLLGLTFNNVSIHHTLFIILTAWWVLLFASACRGALVALPISMLITACVYRRYYLPLLRLQVIHFSLAFLCYGVLFHVLPALYHSSGTGTTKQPILRYTTDDRLTLWRQAGRMILDHPWLGVGPMNFAWYPNTIAAHPHNSLMQLASEWGLLATSLIIAITTYGIYCWIRWSNPSKLSNKPVLERHLLVILFFTLILNACYSLVDGVIVMPISQVLMVLLTGLMFGLFSDKQVLSHNPNKPHLIHRTIAGAALITLVWSVLPELLPRILANEHAIPISEVTMGPRFWQRGGIAH